MEFFNFHMGKCNWAFYEFERKRKQAVRKEIQISLKLLIGLKKRHPWFSLRDYLDVLEKELISGV